MISASITAAIVGILALLGIAPAPWMVGAIWLFAKGAIVVLGLLGAGKLYQRAKAKPTNPDNSDEE